MNNDWSGFAEGDSGVIFTSHVDMPVIRQFDEPLKPVVRKVNTNEFVGEIMAFAHNEKNPAGVRVEAYKLAWQITMDRFNGGDTSLSESNSD